MAISVVPKPTQPVDYRKAVEISVAAHLLHVCSLKQLIIIIVIILLLLLLLIIIMIIIIVYLFSFPQGGSSC